MLLRPWQRETTDPSILTCLCHHHHNPPHSTTFERKGNHSYLYVSSRPACACPTSHLLHRPTYIIPHLHHTCLFFFRCFVVVSHQCCRYRLRAPMSHLFLTSRFRSDILLAAPMLPSPNPVFAFTLSAITGVVLSRLVTILTLARAV